MKNQTAVAVAIALVVSSVGVAIAPSVLAGHTDCHEDYEITSTRQTRPLNTSESEVGLSEVSAPSDEVMNVTLETNNAELEFEVKELDGSDCADSSNVDSDCEDTIKLNTTGSATTDSIECTLPAPTFGDRNFYVPFENVGSVDLEYSVDSA